MSRRRRSRANRGTCRTRTAGALALIAACLVVGLSCDGAIPLRLSTSPIPIVGAPVTGNDLPTLEIIAPPENISVSQGASQGFVIEWRDEDIDSDAVISFNLVNIETNETIRLVQGIQENGDLDNDRVTVLTNLIPLGTYNLSGTIDDGENLPVTVIALNQISGVGPVKITVVPEGTTAQGNEPPQVFVAEPAFNQSVSQDDILVIVILPTEPPKDFFGQLIDPPLLPAEPYDPDSATTLHVLLDFDEDPTNDNVAAPDPNEIILLEEPKQITQGDATAITINVQIDLAQIPSRPDGKPYFIRATISDGLNPPVHAYAAGTINVAQSVGAQSRAIDLGQVGKTLAGARFVGFNPGSRLGTTMLNVKDFDLDGIDDFILVAQFGNPRNLGNIGEAYLIYGVPDIRFGGTINVNSTSRSISGVIFEAPPPRFDPAFFDFLPDDFLQFFLPDIDNPRSDGITDVSVIGDLTGDGRPELLFGLSHVDGVYQGRDDDPSDSPPDIDGEEVDAVAFCYPDPWANNQSSEDDDDSTFEALGFTVVVNSENRDNNGIINPDRLEATVVALELCGQEALHEILDTTDHFADNRAADDGEEFRIAGARFQAGWYGLIEAVLGRDAPPLDGLFGRSVAAIDDLDNDQLAEIIISAPLNEKWVDETSRSFPFSVNLASHPYDGSIIILPGGDYDDNFWRDKEETENGNAIVPRRCFPREDGNCDETNPEARNLICIPARSFEIFAEDIDDFLGGARSAGDFNQDSVPDILCGAPLNDRDDISPFLEDSGALYIIYGRTPTGDINLALASDPGRRPPMLRVRGEKPGDQIGWKQEPVRDVDGDSVDDVLFSSPFADFIIPPGECRGDFDGDGDIDDDDLNENLFNNCMAQVGAEVFLDDACKAFDYNNDRVIDDFDRVVFNCLVETGGSSTCCPVDNGYVGIIYGAQDRDGDRTIGQLARSALRGTIFFGSNRGDRAGQDIASAGDFDKDGFGDILITAPGEIRTDDNERERMGVTYLVFGGPHLVDQEIDLADVGPGKLFRGLVFLSPYVTGRPDEAPTDSVGLLGDINADGFSDIAIGVTRADLIDEDFPQGGDEPGIGRRPDQGDAYIIYGNNVSAD